MEWCRLDGCGTGMGPQASFCEHGDEAFGLNKIQVHFLLTN
jgi:hypothetical protein